MIVEIHSSLKTINDRIPFLVWIIHSSFEGAEVKQKDAPDFKKYLLEAIDRQLKSNEKNYICKKLQIVLLQSNHSNIDIFQFGVNPKGFNLAERNKHMYFCAGYVTGVARSRNLEEAQVPFSLKTFFHFEKQIKSSFRKHMNCQKVIMKALEKAPD